ncbi:crotonase/enoyl-CoA hydratase family protein [Streptomyces virginiae]|uniref:crotonase/enoyl-CoA hydratase family protein n=1 Tax=Streptomyces virginiae TaxID=1961 RepID=UPI0036E16EC4
MNAAQATAADPAPDTRSVLTERHGHLLVMTLNRPHVRNAVDHDLARSLDEALCRLEDDPALRVGILTGADGFFCSGMDLKAFPAQGVPVVEDRGLAGLTRACRSKPLIAAVEGPAVAGGFELALACDLIVAGASAVFGLPEAARGLLAAEGGLIRLPQRLPYHLAMEVILAGRTLDTTTAARHGLLNQVVPDGTALQAALALAETISALPQHAVRASKRIVHATRGLSDADAFAVQDPLSAPVFATDEAAEGAQAFCDKRAPVRQP